MATEPELIYDGINKRKKPYTLPELETAWAGWMRVLDALQCEVALKMIVKNSLSPHGMLFNELKTYFRSRSVEATEIEQVGGIVTDALLAYNDQYAYLKTANKVAVMEPTEYGYDMTTAGVMDTFNQNKSVTDEHGARVPVWKIWTGWKHRRSYEGVEFDPRKAPSSPWTEGPILNLWRGFAVKPAKGDCSLIVKHIEKVICAGNKTAFKYVIRWLAHRVQRPWERPDVAIVLIGEEGAGKSIIADLMITIIGAHATELPGGDLATDRFNAQMENNVFIVAEEAAFAGGGRATGIWKSLITGKRIRIERKYFDAGLVDNYSAYWIISNGEKASAVTMGSRRFLYLDVPDTVVGNKAYFDKLGAQIENDGAAAFHHYLTEIDLAGFDPRYMPQVESRSQWIDMIENAGSVEQWLVNILESGTLPTDAAASRCTDPDGKKRERPDWAKEHVGLYKGKLYDDSLEFCHKRSKGRYDIKTNNAFFHELYRLLPDAAKPERLPAAEGRTRVVGLRTLAECREIFHGRAMHGRGVPGWQQDTV